MQNSVMELIFDFDDNVQSALGTNEEYRGLCKKGLELYGKIKDLLNKEQIELFEKFSEINIDIEGLAGIIYFKEGFKSGLRLAAECFTE